MSSAYHTGEVVVKSIAFLALLVAPAMAGHWDVEKVDSAGWGAAVDMRWHPDGRLFLCYSDTSGIIRLASKDSIWSYEELPQWRPVLPGTQAFDIDRRGNIGVSYVGTDYQGWYVLRADTGWVDIQTPFYPFFPPLTTFDTAGAPAITVQTGDAYALARFWDAAWVTCILKIGDPSWHPWFGGCALGSGNDGVIWGVFWYSYSWPKLDVDGMDLFSFHLRDTVVTVNPIAGGYFSAIGAASGCVDRQGSVHSCYRYKPMSGSGAFYLDQTQIDTVLVHFTTVEFDALDRPQVAYVPWEGGLLYRYLDAGVWHIFDLQTTGVTALSLIIGENLQPLIAYTTSDGVFLAHGIGVTGQSEEQRGPNVVGSGLIATVARNVLLLPISFSSTHTSLFDTNGRRVADLRSGPNDVSRLVPGVYFVREAQAVRKVVITR